MKNFYPVLLLFILSSVPFLSRSQGKRMATADAAVSGMEANRKTAAPYSVLFNETADYKLANVQQVFSRYLGLRSGTDELRFKNRDVAGAITVERYQQYFKGIRVEHGSYVVTAKDGKVAFINGDFYAIEPSTSIVPQLTEDAARTNAWLHVDGVEPNDLVKAAGELVFVENDFQPQLDGKVHLAYKFFIESRTKAMTMLDVFVDAATGKILFIDSKIKSGCFKTDKTKTDPLAKKPVSPTGVSPEVVAPIASSRYSGDLNTMVTRQVSGSYRLESLLATELSPVYTKNINHALVSTFTLVSQYTAAMAAATEITDADNNWTAAEYNNANKDNTAFDVHWGAQRVYDYWKTRHSRNSWDNANGTLNCYVHADANFDNAFWQGGGGINSMFYGDGSNVAGGFLSLTCLDVTGHEIGHAVCQATSNLAYNRESGAMNEGFSDIWGASIEHYGDPHETDAVAKVYFDIGEEICKPLNGKPLRSMSNPNSGYSVCPDTYGGTFWVDPSVAACPTPNNGNDQCGVHTNSGVLNYWFYLMVSGGTGTNDVGNAFNVNAIGWVDAERIAFLAEQNLTSTATYSACRTASINAATTLFGACSAQTESVTRAWYAVNVGANFVPCTPQIQFSTTAQTVTESGATGATCLKTKTITVPVTITAAATQSATVSFTLSGTASNGAALDYTISPATVTFPAASAAAQNLTVTINNDAYVESDETIIITINTVTTTGNAVKGSLNQQHTVTITSDDYAPSNAKLLTSQSIYSQDFTAATGFSQSTSGGTNIWRLGNNSGTTPYFGSGNGCAYVSQNTSSFTYSLTGPSAARLETPSINTTNATNLQLTFDYVCNGELFSGTYYDYGTLWYSTDAGVNWTELNSTVYQGTTSKTTVTVPIPSVANNITTLQLGFRWDNDDVDGNQPPFGIDNIVVRGDVRTAASVQTAVNSGVSSDQQYLGPNATVNFYDNISGNVMGTIQNLSSHDYGCTTFEVDRAGTSAQFVTGDPGVNNKQRLASKTFRVTPTTNLSTGTYRITLYYTAAEKSGYEAASTRVWVADNGVNNGVKISKSPGAVSSLTYSSSGVRSEIESVGTFGSDYTVTAQFNNGFSGFVAGVAPLTIVPVTIVNFAAAKSGTGILVNWQVAQQINIRNYVVEHSTDGVNFTAAGTVTSSSLDNAAYNFTHAQPASGNNFYRLKIMNADGSYRYSAIVKVNLSAKAGLVIAPNPVTNLYTIQYSSSNAIRKITVTDAVGKIVKELVPGSAIGSVVMDAANYASGVYMVKMLMEDNSVITQKMIKQ